MSEPNKYAIADHVVCRKTNAQLRMLFDRTKGVMYELNESGSAIVEALEGGARSRSELLEALKAQFDGPEDDMRQDVEDFLGDFVEAKLINEVSS